MRFSRLRLNGFKSFVDPTDLVIADGLTGVVGPNGCGKSNLLEALRWVMGENRPTAMRGGGMEDVIFAGAASRPARNFAEVTLALDNADRTAPAAFNESDALDVVRRITRDAGSAYKLNGKDVRARDVQMLFADASTGAHSPALVRQGQISELINAKPQRRRRILEEAAGISGLYQRRHEAELKLNGTEANLARVDDVVEQLAAQLATLARQAKQAARYREIGTALRQAEGMLLYRRWREADAARATAESELRERLTAVAQAERASIGAEEARVRADDALPALREEEAVAGAILQRLEVSRDTLAEREAAARATLDRLTATIARLVRDAEREGALNEDARATIDRLRQEDATLTAQTDGQEAAMAEAQEAALDASRVLGAREEELSALTEDLARLSARHQSVTRLVEESAKRLTQVTSARDAAEAQVKAAQSALDGSDRARAEAQATLTRAQDAAATADADLSQAEATREAAQDREAAARTERAEAEGTAGTIGAEVSALTKLLARDSGDGAPLVDQVTVAPGFEAALGAAYGDDLRASALSGTEVEDVGWAPLPPYDRVPALPDGIAPLAPHVTAPEVLSRGLDQIGLVDPDQAAQMQPRLLPGQVLVSREGDLWRWDGFRATAEAAPSAAALRLQQMNRLASLRQDLEEATARAEGTRAAHEALGHMLSRAKTAEAQARETRRNADRSLTEAGRALAKAEGAHGIAASRLETAQMAVSRHEADTLEARAAVAEAEAARRDLPPLDGARSALEAIRTTVEAARMAMMSRRAQADELKRDAEARDTRLREIGKDMARWQKRLDNADAQLADLTRRREAAEVELAAAQGVPEDIAAQGAALVTDLEKAAARRTLAIEARAAAETHQREALAATRDADRAAGEAREARARAETRVEAAQEALSAARDRIAEALETTPGDLLAALDLDPEALPPLDRIEADVTRLKRQRDALGSVNLRAEEDAQQVQTEHDALLTEKADLEQAVAELRAGIASLNKEGRQRLLDAFETVNGNFSMLFRHLFSGGEARLELVESDDPLEAGLEIMCHPPGKKLSTLSLLSGGEQTLTALALIFAVFLANPAPICVLDEVDAPLDDANVTRFCDMLDEMTRRTSTRFLIITHHAVTMARMDRLFGVTMVEQGVSQLVSVDLKRAEALVA
ncbi:chromosome partition protein Smc [Jannaschia pagri]|uniref:Chromosome partition protein Smc n=1 Tax=Jannaschia pagri TaxID=2829797 RepID=A0ABQ4NI20_9RHOB|nr:MULTISPECIES: chromosome segregation protein SMC [unclassified Jannaschia]GIT89824.1 chromosome partition protein Smc [Jannaschia sp. AI_61]GIT94069.1 chromosome partition protein Smc [Jannaschia sp. AI_62]